MFLLHHPKNVITKNTSYSLQGLQDYVLIERNHRIFAKEKPDGFLYFRPWPAEFLEQVAGDFVYYLSTDADRVFANQTLQGLQFGTVLLLRKEVQPQIAVYKAFELSFCHRFRPLSWG